VAQGPRTGTDDEAVLIESVAAGGDGVGRLADGITVFVPRTAPGDRVSLTRIRRSRHHARAAVARVVVPGPGRVEPRCAHFVRDGCGGCQWQHLSAEAQQAAKRRVVGDALRRIGGLAVEDPLLVPSPRAFGYRATITLTVRWAPEGPIAGFHRDEAADPVFALERCEIARDEVDALWTALRPALAALPRGTDVRLKLRVAPDGALHVVVGGGLGAWTTPQPLAAAAAAAGLAATVWWEPTAGAVRRMAGPPADRGAVAFEQVNPEVAAALRSAVLEVVPPAAGRALDLYAGAAEIGLALAARGWNVDAVEADPGAAARAGEQARRQGSGLRVVADRVERCLGGLLPADLVIANPPRAGLDAAVTALLADRPPARLVYVSCDPATLARDLKRLGAEPARLALRCFDMFPQTSHVETLAVLERGVVVGPLPGRAAG
jgi:23S rRNA (uracil1939-C5)-methyltransferase